jgi:PAS domain S-box-containing protein
MIEKSRATFDRLKKIIASQQQLLEIEKDLPVEHSNSETCQEPTYTVINRLREHRRELDDMNVELGKYINELGRRTNNRDITDLKQAEKALKLTQASIDLAANEILWITPEGKIVYANEATCKALQRSRDELLGMYMWDIQPKYTMEKWQEHWQEIKKRGSFTFETIHYTKDGREIPVEASVNYVKSDGNEFNFTYIKDITDRKRSEEALRASEERLRRASRAGCIGLFEWNYDRGYGYFSPETYQLCELGPDTPATYETLLATVHPDDREKVECAFAEIHEKARNMSSISAQIEYRVVHLDGEVLWLLVTATCNIECGDLIVRGAVRDITERKRAEETLQASEERYRELVENANSIILRFDLRGNLTFFNEYAEKLLGYSKDEVLGRNVLGTIVPPTESTGRDLNAMITDIKRYPERYRSNVNENVCKNGDRLWIAWTNKAIRDEHGNVVEILSVGNDVTERMRAEEALWKSEERLRRASRAGRVGLYEWNVDRDQTYFSTEAYELYGLEPGSPVTYETWLRRVHQDDREMVERSIVKNRKNARLELDLPAQIEYRVLRDDGAVLWLEVLSTFALENGDLIVWGAVRDITERKRAEKELEEEKQQAELYLDLMGHDINNFNLVARGYMELIDGMVEDRELKELVSKPLEAIDGSSRLIQNVQKLQRTRSCENHVETLDLGMLVEEIAGQFKSLSDKSVDINCDAVKGINVLANELLRDVFTNLIGNAIKHSPESPHIDIRMVPDEKDGLGYCRVIIEDNGPGVPYDMKEKIFTRLSRGNTKARGSGLGLYLVKTLVESYGGKVWVEDRVKGDHTKGSRFMVELPVV